MQTVYQFQYQCAESISIRRLQWRLELTIARSLALRKGGLKICLRSGPPACALSQYENSFFPAGCLIQHSDYDVCLTQNEIAR